MRIRPILLTLLVASATAATASSTPSPAQLDHLIRRDGAKVVAQKLSESQFDFALRQASRGDGPWLHAIVALRAGSDGARSEGIDKALSDALQTNPATVLALVNTHPDLPRVDWFCQDRAIEPSAQAVTRFTDRARRSVAAVRDPTLRPLRDSCLISLRRKA